jgi:hypothetical protein
VESGPWIGPSRIFGGIYKRNFYGALLFGIFIVFGRMRDRSALECGSIRWNKWGDGSAVSSGKCGGWSVAIYAKSELNKLWIVLVLAGCGVNGAPERPAKAVPAAAGLTLSGEAAAGIAKNGS